MTLAQPPVTPPAGAAAPAPAGPDGGTLFRQRCGSCHGALKQEAELRLDAVAAPLQGRGELTSRDAAMIDEDGYAFFAGRADVIQFVQRLFGSALSADVQEHVLPILWGQGANGKSVLTETMLSIFGPDYDFGSSAMLQTLAGGKLLLDFPAEAVARLRIANPERDERRAACRLARESARAAIGRWRHSARRSPTRCPTSPPATSCS